MVYHCVRLHTIRVIAVTATLVVACLLLLTGIVIADQPKLTKLGGIGDACGFVVDAETGEYIDGAQVELLLPSDVEPIKGTTATTAREGFYQIKAPIGSVKTSFAVERLLDLSIMSAVFGVAKKVEKFINVTQLYLRVQREGFKPFEGPVLVFTAEGDNFTAWLCPVELAPNTVKYQSFSDLSNGLGEIESIELSNVTPAPGEKVGIKMTCKEIPKTPQETIGVVCSIGWTRLRLKGNTEGRVTTLSGELPMLYTELGVFRDKKRNLDPGLYGLKCNNFESLVRHDEWKTTPQMYHLGQVKLIAVGVDTARQSEVAAALSKLNDRSLQQSDAVFKALYESILAVFPKNDKPYVWDKAESDFIQGKYQDAWKPFASIEKYLDADTRLTIYKSAALIAKNSGDFKAYASLNSAIKQGYSVNDKAGFQKSLDAIRPMPQATKPQDKIDAASALFVVGKDQEAVAYLESIAADKNVGPDALLALANYYQGRGDEAKAVTLYGKAFEQRQNKVRGFYPNYLYGRLLLKNGQRDASAKFFAQALSDARNESQDISDPQTPVSLPNEAGHLEQYKVFTGPLSSYAVGYAYAEASSLLLILSCFDSFDKPEDDWMSTATLGKSLVEIGLPNVALPILEKAAARFSDQQHVLAAYALALHVSGEEPNAAKVLDQLLNLNPKNPDGLRLAELSKPKPVTAD